jgi:hypothetical protein
MSYTKYPKVLPTRMSNLQMAALLLQLIYRHLDFGVRFGGYLLVHKNLCKNGQIPMFCTEISLGPPPPHNHNKVEEC